MTGTLRHGLNVSRRAMGEPFQMSRATVSVSWLMRARRVSNPSSSNRR